MTRWIILACIAVLTLSLTGCSGTLGELLGDDAMGAKIGGSSWDSTNSILEITGDTVLITGADYKGRAISITLYNRDDLPGTVILNSTTGKCVYTPLITNPGDSYTSYDNSGMVIVDSISSSRCKGTFSFKAKNDDDEEITITNGYFDMRTD